MQRFYNWLLKPAVLVADPVDEQDIWNKGFEEGFKKASEDHEALVERHVQNKFSELNYLVNPLHIFQVSPMDIAYLGHEPITKDKARQLKLEATMLKETLLWDVFQSTVRQKAIDQGFKNSTEWRHVEPAKTMVMNLDVLKSIVLTCLNIDLEKLPEGTPSKQVR